MNKVESYVIHVVIRFGDAIMSLLWIHDQSVGQIFNEGCKNHDIDS